MKIVSHLALLGALVSAVQACATPVELKGCPAALPAADCDVLLASSSDFPDAGFAGAAGNGSGGNPNASQGGAGGINPGPGGSGNLGGAAGSGNGLAGAGQGGVNSGSAGAGAGGAAGGGLGGSGGVGTAGAGGTGGAGSQGVFDPDSCDFTDRTGCEDLGCQNCPDNNFCPTNCPPIVACVEANLGCSTALDPLCGGRDGNVENVCLDEVEPSGGANPTTAGSPAAFARALVECLCTVPRPAP
jgi:hypothetical protein